uniref:Integrase catalytic domain-containing protein n=1 Tax=Cyprinus carpio TaxID=7962 RepID=A0A8C1S4H7_CYPCA
MCAATRYPEAVPIRTLEAKVVVKELVKFCSTFGLPKIIQSDRGTNFTSHVFRQVLRELGVKHQLSSAYHPESQGALERFHQTLKSMLRAYCLDTGKDWGEGLPLLMFAIRETVQESLGFSPAELVFGHTVRGPLKLSEQLLSKTTSPMSLLDYVSSFRERLHRACEVSKQHLVKTQSKMKAHYDKQSVVRNFQPGEKVLVLLPVPGSALQAKFPGPYVVERKLGETDYVISTPDRKRKTRLCYINMLKDKVGISRVNTKTCMFFVH